MTRRQFLVLLLTFLVLGGIGLALFWQDRSAYRTSARVGGQLLPQLRVAEVAQVHVRDGDTQATLARKENHWVVEERSGYPADFKAISDLIIKLNDAKIVQVEPIGPSLHPRVQLVEPGRGEGAGTQVELKDADGKTLASVILGRQILKPDPGNPLPSARDGVPAGRYVRFADKTDEVVVVSDPLSGVEARPGRWLDKQFIRIDRIRTLAVAGEAEQWRIARDLEWGQWRFAAGGGTLDPSAAVQAVNALGNLSFSDVWVGKPPAVKGSPITITAETFDNLVYTLRLVPLAERKQYLLDASIVGEPPRKREIEKDENAEERARRDKQFEENRKLLELRLARDRAIAQWTYVVDAGQVAPVLRPREELAARPRAADGDRRL
jgi:hypothetical protein